MEGEEGHCVPDEEKKSKEFKKGRLLAAILLVKPRWLKGSRERRRLIPADLEDYARLGKKAFGKKWEIKLEMFDYRNAKLMPKVARIVFRGSISAVQLLKLLQEGQAKYEKMILEKEAARLEKIRREDVAAFLTWLRHPSPLQRAAIMDVVHSETVIHHDWPISYTCIQDVMERDTALSIQEWDTMHKNDKAVMEVLRNFWVENGKHVSIQRKLVGLFSLFFCSFVAMCLFSWYFLPT